MFKIDSETIIVGFFILVVIYLLFFDTKTENFTRWTDYQKQACKDRPKCTNQCRSALISKEKCQELGGKLERCKQGKWDIGKTGTRCKDFQQTWGIGNCECPSVVA